MQPHVGLGFQNRRHFVDHFQHDVGQIVGGVPAIGTHAGERQKLAESSGNALVSGMNLRIIGSIGMYPETFENFLTELAIHTFLERILPNKEEDIGRSDRNSLPDRGSFRHSSPAYD